MNVRSLGLVGLLSLVVAPAPGAENQGAVNLLQLESAVLEPTGVPGFEPADVAKLFDGQPSTAGQFPAAAAQPVELVFGFGEETVTIQKLIVQLPSGSSRDAAVGVELLVSNLSPHAGFRTVRTCQLKPQTKPQEFGFVATGARWVMLRVVPHRESTAVKVAECDLRGYVGPPATAYEFNESPAHAIEVIAGLKKLVRVQLAEDENSLIADAADGRLDEFSFAEAALIASGVTHRADREPFLARIDDLEQNGRRAVAGAKTTWQKGDRLLQFLHSGPMASGYSKHQTRLSTLLDTGHFNCVSSSTLYNIMGRRMGLDLRAIEVPDHAFSILYDGTQHADVEATCPVGFNPSRNAAAQQSFQQQTGLRYIPDRHPDERREISAAGLVGIIYYNRGVSRTAEQKYDEALIHYFCALSLDPEFDSAVKNALATLANWSLDLAKREAFDDALAVVNTGLELAPKDATLKNNRLALWSQRVALAIDRGHTDLALSLLDEAHRQVPDGNFRAQRSWVFLKPAEQLISQGEWQSALDAANAGLAALDGAAVEELRKWRAGLFLRWANQHLNDGQFAASLEILERGALLIPHEPRLKNNIAFVAQEWARALLEREGSEAAETMLARLATRHPGAQEVARSYVVRRINHLKDTRQYSPALACIERCRELAGDDETIRKLHFVIYDRWTSDLAKSGDWEQAVAVYERALGRFPGDSHLRRNLAATWDQWARSCFQSERWIETIDVYTRASETMSESRFEKNMAYSTKKALDQVGDANGSGHADRLADRFLASFGDQPHIVDAVALHYQHTAIALVRGGDFDSALDAIGRGRVRLAGHESLDQAVRAVFDDRAQQLAKEGQWQHATDVYSAGLELAPGDQHLQRNAVVIWNQWAKSRIESRDWGEAIRIYETALERFPATGLLQNNLDYCRQNQADGE